jgi:hypothetical protein
MSPGDCRCWRVAPRVEVRGEVTAAGVSVIVADDRPEGPESERAVIEGGAEVPHDQATNRRHGGTDWATATLGGALSFGESDRGGTAVTIVEPRRDGA